MSKTLYDLPKTARAAVITEFHKDLDLSDSHPVPSAADLKPGTCLVKVDYAGVCHSDLHVKNDAFGLPTPLPLVGGHEGIGTVVAIGNHTVDSPVKLGDRVGMKWTARSCLKCESRFIFAVCRRSSFNSSRNTGCRKGMEGCEYSHCQTWKLILTKSSTQAAL